MKKSVSEQEPLPYRLPKISKSPLIKNNREVRGKTNDGIIYLQQNNRKNRLYSQNTCLGSQHTRCFNYERSESDNAETGQEQQNCRIGKQVISEKKRVKRLSENGTIGKKTSKKYSNGKFRYQNKKENQSMSKNNIYSSPICISMTHNYNSSSEPSNLRYSPKGILNSQYVQDNQTPFKTGLDKFRQKPSIQKKYASLNPRDTDDTSSLTSKNQQSELSSFRYRDNSSEAYSVRSKENRGHYRSNTVGKQQQEMIQREIYNLDLLYEKIKKQRCIFKKGQIQKQSQNSSPPKKDTPQIVDHTMMNFEKSIKKNREYIHNEIVKNLSMKKNKNTYSLKNNENSKQCDLSKSATKQMEIPISLRDPISERNSRTRQEDIKRVRKTQNADEFIQGGFDQHAKNQSNFDPQFFEELSKIILRRMTANQYTSEISNQNRKHLNNIKYKQFKKIEKLAEKCKHYSPTKSIQQIKEETQEELEKQYGVFSQEKSKQKCKQQTEQSKNSLKSEKNYMEWRRFHLFADSKIKQGISKKKIPRVKSRDNSIQSGHKNGVKTSGLYKQSSYEIENSKLSEFYLKTEINLEEYFQNKNEADRYRKQPPPLYQGRQ